LQQPTWPIEHLLVKFIAKFFDKTFKSKKNSQSHAVIILRSTLFET